MFRIYRRLFFKFWTENAHFTFLNPPPPLRVSKATYTTFIGKLVVDFLFAFIELLSLGVMSEALRANIDWKLALWKGVGHFQLNFHAEVNVTYE